MAEPRVFTLEERPDLVARLQEVTNDESWPEFALHSNVAIELWKELRSHFFDFQWVLLDEERDQVIGMGYSAPLAWDGWSKASPPGSTTCSGRASGTTPRACGRTPAPRSRRP